MLWYFLAVNNHLEWGIGRQTRHSPAFQELTANEPQGGVGQAKSGVRGPSVVSRLPEGFLEEVHLEAEWKQDAQGQLLSGPNKLQEIRRMRPFRKVSGNGSHVPAT